MREQLRDRLTEKFLYIYENPDTVSKLLDLVEKTVCGYKDIKTKSGWLTEKDSILITYGDTLYREGEPTLTTLKKFLSAYVKDAISTIHLLPMYPYTSDDGFSVVDYKKINPVLGDWKRAGELAEEYDLMYDAVINHISKSSDWFRRFCLGEKPYDEFFIESDPDADYSLVVRPRVSPLLTRVETNTGGKYLWTTFSDDQIDLNYRSIYVYDRILDVLLYYAKHGARFIRLDAVGYLWKETGTACIHHPKTHEIIKTYRLLLEEYAPGTFFITETNVPHKENISYLGNGRDEAHLIYQFPLPPLTMFSLLTGSAGRLAEWLDQLDEPCGGCAYFNFLSSHDGIGIKPVDGILNEEEKQVLLDAALRNGGEVSYKDNGDGSRSPYELNINYQDALASPEETDEIRIRRFIAAETILLSLQGLPGIYIHSLLGSRNDYYGKTVSGIPRRINREKLELGFLEKSLGGGNRKRIFDELIRRLNIRKQHREFSPEAHQKILFLDDRLLALERYTDGGDRITAVINVSSEKVTTYIGHSGIDLMTQKKKGRKIELEGYQCMWIADEGN